MVATKLRNNSDMRASVRIVAMGALAVSAMVVRAENWKVRQVPNTPVSVMLPVAWTPLSTAGASGKSSSQVKQYKATIGSVGVLAVVTKVTNKADSTLEKLQQSLASRMTYTAPNGDSSRATSMKIVSFKGRRILRGAALFQSKSGNQNTRVIAYTTDTQTIIVNIGYSADDRRAYEVASKIDKSFDIR